VLIPELGHKRNAPVVSIHSRVRQSPSRLPPKWPRCHCGAWRRRRACGRCRCGTRRSRSKAKARRRRRRRLRPPKRRAARSSAGALSCRVCAQAHRWSRQSRRGVRAHASQRGLRVCRGAGAPPRRRVRLEARHHGELARIKIGAADLWLLKPMNFMNRSGSAAHSVAAFYKASAPEVLVAYDDLDLPAGVARLREAAARWSQRHARCDCPVGPDSGACDWASDIRVIATKCWAMC